VKGFIIFRDRVTYASRCAKALAAVGLDVVVIDNGTTYPPAKAWLEVIQVRGLAQVLWKGGGHPQEIWGWDPFRRACGEERYIVTDPDVVPDDGCPKDWLGYLGRILDANPDVPKAGLGLRIDNIPEYYQHRDHVIEWESQFWANETSTPGVYASQIDTTLALYQPLRDNPHFNIDGYRTGQPYVAQHLAWYEDLADLPPELQYYHENTEPGISFWTLEGRSAWNT
jgi:hypothetical protein